ncbi:MAG: SLC13 family permease [Geminicoccaceae bacterium]|nr:SLC13 family permease [Geminicoccaceae bacterium]
MNLAHGLTGLIVLLALALAVLPDAFGVPAALGAPAAIVVLAIGLWATNALEVHITALIVFVIVTWLGIAPPEVIFAGFAAPALWLVFGGLVIAAAIEVTGLGGRAARLIAVRLGGSYRRIVYGTVLVCVVLSFLVPAAMGRIVILLPIFRALAEGLGFEDGSRGSRGILLAVAYGSFFPALAILPANLPNMVLLGAMETVYGASVSYVGYLVLHFPVLGVLKAVLVAEVLARLFGDRSCGEGTASGAEPDRPWSAGERRLAVILALALLVWASDWLHGISPGWVALLAGVLCLVPWVGVVDRGTFERRINFSSFFYVAALLGVVRLIDQSGLGDWLGSALLGHLPLDPAAPMLSFFWVVGLNSVTSLLTALAGMPAVLTPLAGPIAAESGLSLQTVLMSQVIGFSATMLPYQSAPIMVALALARVPLATAARASLTIGLLTLLLLVPLQALWWRLLGVLP